jgi:transcription-repair coupling factor (superfamily II helicase)
VKLTDLYHCLEAAGVFEPLHVHLEHLAASTRLHLRGLAGSLPAFVLYDLSRHLSIPLLCLTSDEEQAAYLFSDLEQLLGVSDRLLRFPATGQKPYDAEQIPDPAPLMERTDVLRRLAEGFNGLLVTSAEAIAERVPAPDRVRQETLVLSSGMAIDPNELLGRLIAQGFERVEFVEAPGEVALRGGILDVYPFTGTHPLRLEFFGDEIDSIREFDPRTQRSISRLTTAYLAPNLSHLTPETPTETLFEHLSPQALLVLFEEGAIFDALHARFAEAEQAYYRLSSPTFFPPPSRAYLSPAELVLYLNRYPTLLLGALAEAETFLSWDTHPQPLFHGNLNLLRERLQENAHRGWKTFILCDSRSQEARLHDLLEEEIETGSVRLLVESLHEGFEVPQAHLAVYTDHQIFGRYHRPTTRKRRRLLGSLSLRALQNLQPGDYVVHVDFGIGQFAGLQRITIRDKQQEVVRLHYANGDVLYVSVNALHKLHRYTGKEGHLPALTKLGSGQWEKLKARTKKRVKDIARDLIQLYAKRKASRGYAFSPDTVWQREMEAAFEYEDTPDQAAAAEAVKRDMEQPIPMDRLVCGDVGFGKTEIAIRAAFKAVQDGKQVALLVPTTILADQHYETFRRRLAPYPVRIEVLSRFRSPAQQQAVLRDLASGKVDIVIGTHRLLSKDVQFKDLGLLIVDEEQRFGVAAKERLRQLRVEVDTLTLTATPIPRTLQFALMGARDLSIIATPPPNRQPIVTEIHTFDETLIRDAIRYEISRGGQVFFIHNRVQSLHEMAARLQAIVPEVRIAIAHGQMKAHELERVMHDFMARKYDVLVSTNIIESGLDIPNANTIFINHAEQFGLADLHQLRGRVGRSDRKAFCYLLVPSIHGLSREARQRLQAIEEFSELGSGFSIAMRDLDIRGAGNLLGAEQSGFIEEIGFETYQQILEEAIRELQEEEFSGLVGPSLPPKPPETAVDVEADAFIPETYVASPVERLNLYRRLSEANDEVAILAVREELRDRFGPVPVEVENLLWAARLKLLGQALRLPKVLFRNQRLFLELPTQDEDPFFYEKLFLPLLERLSQLDRRYVLKEQGPKLRVIIQEIPDLKTAWQLLQQLEPVNMTASAPACQA